LCHGFREFRQHSGSASAKLFIATALSAATIPTRVGFQAKPDFGFKTGHLNPVYRDDAVVCRPTPMDTVGLVHVVVDHITGSFFFITMKQKLTERPLTVSRHFAATFDLCLSMLFNKLYGFVTYYHGPYLYTS
jgi:hypothetical protein